MPRLPFPLFPLAFLTAIFYLNFVSRIILGPFLPVIEHELGLGHGGAGSLFLFIQIGYATGLLGSGFVSWRFTHRHTIVTSAVVVGIAMVGLSLAASLGAMRFWLVLGRRRGGPVPSLRRRHHHASGQRRPLGQGAGLSRASAQPRLHHGAALGRSSLCHPLVARRSGCRGKRGDSPGWLLCPFGPWGKPTRRAAAPSDHGRSAPRPIRVGHDAYLRRRGRVEPRRV